MLVSGLRIFDWEGESKILFASGGFEGNAVADAQGQARIQIQSRPPLLAYTRPYQDSESLIAQALDSLIPTAYADTPASCAAAMAPIPADAEDINILRAEQFMNTILECFILNEVEEARVKVQTSQGLIEKTMAIVERETIEGLYFVLKQQKNAAVVVLNCLDAAITGSNASAVGAGCDFITSMLAIGDVRDLLIQGWNYNFNEDEYDALTAGLAGVGLVASAAQLAGGLGTAPSAMVAAGKTIAKRLSAFGPVGKATADVLGSHLGRIVRDPNLSVGEKVSRVGALVPVFEIGAAAAVIQQTEPRLFGLLVHAMSTPDKFERLSSWMQDYLARLGAELVTAQHEVKQHWLDYFISSAHAALMSEAVRDAFLDGLRKIIERLDGEDIKVVATNFDEAVDQFIDLKNNDSLYAFRAVAEDHYVIKAFMNVDAIGGDDAVRHFARNSGWTIGMDSVFSVEQMVQSIADMRIDRVTRTPAELSDALQPEYAAEVKRGLKGTINKLENPNIGFKVTKGHMAHYLITVDLLNSGAILRGVEMPDIKIDLDNDIILPLRWMDIELEIDGRLYYWEVKNFTASTWSNNLVTLFGSKVGKSASESLEATEAGQLMTDLAKLYREASGSQPEHLRQWVFTPDVLGQSGKPTAEQIVEMERVMTDRIVELIDDPKYEDLLIGHLNIDKKKIIEKDQAEMRKFRTAVNDLKKMVRGTHSNTPQKLIKIYPFDNLVPTPGA